ncbi:MAG: hypothetical protein IJM81_09550 [Prevotella sp.]|nr:hypothetical protein [Prevotella sp.]
MLYLYFKERYPKQEFSVPDLRLPGESMMETELADPVTEGNFSFDPEKVFKVDRNAYPIPEVHEAKPSNGTSWRYEFSFGNDEVMRLCKANGCTPPILASILMQRAILALNPSADKPVLCSLACDWREAIGLPDTFRNCVTSIYLPFTEDEKGEPLSEVGPKFRSLVKAQKEIDSARAGASVMTMLSGALSKMNTFDEKAAMVEKFTSNPVDSFVLSYTGQAKLGDLEQYIDSIHVYSSGVHDFFLQMTAVGNRITIDMVQPFPEPHYADAFGAECSKEGLDYTRSEAIPFSTPKDKFRRYRTLWEILSRPLCHRPD